MLHPVKYSPTINVVSLFLLLLISLITSCMFEASISRSDEQLSWSVLDSTLVGGDDIPAGGVWYLYFGKR